MPLVYQVRVLVVRVTILPPLLVAKVGVVVLAEAVVAVPPEVKAWEKLVVLLRQVQCLLLILLGLLVRVAAVLAAQVAVPMAPQALVVLAVAVAVAQLQQRVAQVVPVAQQAVAEAAVAEPTGTITVVLAAQAAKHKSKSGSTNETP